MSELLDATSTPPESAPSSPGPKRTDGYAVASLVMGLIGFLVITIPIGLVLGVAGFVRARGGHRKGAGLALAGVALSVLWAAGAGLAAWSLVNQPGEPKRDAKGEVTAPATAAPDALKVGDCVGNVTEGEVESVQAVPCTDEKREGKVYASFTLADGDWPGDTKIDELAGEGCTSRYEKAGSPEGDEAEVFFLRPTQDSWGLGDRDVSCVVSLTP